MPDNDAISQFKIFRWNPRWTDIAPFSMWALSGAVLQIARAGGSFAPLMLEWITPLLDLMFFVLPLLFIRLAEKQTLEYIGISKRRIGAALIMGLTLGLFLTWISVSRSLGSGQTLRFPPFLNFIAYLLGTFFHLLAIEFFYRGWIASHFERSYGFLPAVLGCGFLYGISPLFTWGMDVTLPSVYASWGFFWGGIFPYTLLMGVLLAAIARLTRNLLAPVLAMLPQMLLADLFTNGAANRISHPYSSIIGIVALAGIVAVVLWITQKKQPSS